MLVCFINTNRYRDIFALNKLYFFHADHMTSVHCLCRCEVTGWNQVKCDGTRAETRFRVSAKRTSPFKSAERQFSRLLAADVWASVVVWRVLTTHSIRQFFLYFPSFASPCAITFQLKSTICSPSSIAAAVAVPSVASPEHAASRHAQGFLVSRCPSDKDSS
jgi:hypothetical protein